MRLIAKLGRIVRRKREPPHGKTGEAVPLSLAILAPAADRQHLELIFREAGLPLKAECSWERAKATLESEHVPVVLYDSARADRPWRQAVSELASSGAKPCVVLLSDRIDPNLKSEAIRNGGYDLLRTPVDGHSVAVVIRSGWLFWRNHAAVRGSMAARPGPA